MEFIPHASLVEIASFNLIGLLLKGSNLRFFANLTGRLVDFSIFETDQNLALPFQVKTMVTGDYYDLGKPGKYNGINILLLDVENDLFVKLLKADEFKTAAEITINIRNIYLIPAKLQSQLPKLSTTHYFSHHLQVFRIKPEDFIENVRSMLHSKDSITHSLAFWDSLAIAETSNTEYRKYHQLLNCFADHLDYQFISVYPVLPFDAYLKKDSRFYKLQNKYSASGIIALRKYCMNSFDILCVHHPTSVNIHYFIPMTILNSKGLIKDNAKNYTIRLSTYKEYEIDFTIPDVCEKLDKILALASYSETEDKFYLLPGYELRYSSEFVKYAVQFSSLTRIELFEMKDNLLPLNIERVEDPRPRRLPHVCPHCDYSGKHMGRHMASFCPELLKNYNVGFNQHNQLAMKRWKCSECGTQCSTKDKTNRHIKRFDVCNNAVPIALAH
jgi:hypothetical protein